MEKKQQVQKAFGQVLHDLRLARNLTQAELAEKSDMDETYVSDLERGNYMPTLLTILKLCKGLEVTLNGFTAQFEKQLK